LITTVPQKPFNRKRQRAKFAIIFEPHRKEAGMQPTPGPYQASSSCGKRLSLPIAAAILLLSAFQPALAAPSPPPDNSGPDASLAPEAKELLANAQAALKVGNTPLALINLKNAAVLAPRSAVVQVLLAKVMLLTNDAASAERQLRQARRNGLPDEVVLPPLLQVMIVRHEFSQLLERFPNPSRDQPAAADILRARAAALQATGHPSEAITTMDAVLQLRRDAPSLLERARLSLQQGDATAAERFADEAIQKSPGYTEAVVFKINLLREAGKTEAALALTDRLIERQPNNLEARLGRVELYLGQKQDAKAKSEVDAILAKYPKSSQALFYQAMLAVRAGDTKTGWSLAQGLPSDFIDRSPKVAVTVAEMAQANGRAEIAASMLSRALVNSPGDLTVRLMLASIRLAQDSPKSALELLDPVKNSPDPDTIRLLARTYTALYRKDDAANALKRLNGPAPNNGQAMARNASPEELSAAAAKEPGNLAVVAPLLEALIQARKYAQALSVAEQLGRNPAQQVTALVYKGNILTLQHEFDGARTAFDQAVQLSPKNVAALYSRANFLLASHQDDEAARDFRAVLALDGKNADALERLAAISARQGNDRQARDLLRQAIAASSQPDQPRIALIRYLMGRRDWNAAQMEADAFARLAPANPDAVSLQGQILSAMGKKAEAVASFRRLTSLLPKEPAPQVLLAEALSAAGDRTGAEKAMETGVALAPSSVEVTGSQIGLQLAQGRADDAIANAKAFQKAHPGAGADILLTDTLISAKHADQAWPVFIDSLARRPSQDVLLRAVQLAVSSNDIKRAGALLSRWIARHPDDMAARMRYADLLMGAKQDAAAISQYEAVLREDKSNVLALNNLGWLLRQQDPKRALNLLIDAAAQAPDAADVADTLGWVKLQQKDPAGGLEAIQHAHALRPQDGQITYHLAVALDANSRRDEARKILKDLIASKTEFPDRPTASQLAVAWR
jgi:putative PEP-CTERM system TPR-repeat lipoprotein